MSDIFHEFVLKPHRSATIVGQKWLMWVLLGLIVIKFIVFAMAWDMFDYANSQWLTQAQFIILFFLLLPVFLVLGALYWYNRSLRLTEVITITRERLHLRRIEPSGKVLEFQTDPHWVKIELIDTAKMNGYLTLRDQYRHVEVGSFLPYNERLELYNELTSIQKKLV